MNRPLSYRDLQPAVGIASYSRVAFDLLNLPPATPIEHFVMPSTWDWQLAFVLPNLQLGSGERSTLALTLGLDGIAIVPTSDPRVVEITNRSEAARRFLSSFHDGNGRPIAPAALVVRRDWLADMKRNAEPVIAFRNAVAAASILWNRACWRRHGWLGVSWSEAFDYHPARLRRDGSAFDSWTPAMDQIGFQLDGLSLTPDLRLPRDDRLDVDGRLADHLGRVWHLRYRRGRDKRKAARVFRSLETAYEALSLRFKSFASLTEAGLDTVHWTTAIEVLASPPNRNVRKWDCHRLVAQWEGYRQELRAKRYWVKRGGRQERMTLAPRIFLHLYRARSKFVHGDKVSGKLLMPFGYSAPPLNSLASTIYRTALVVYLERHWPRKLDFTDPHYIDFAGMQYEEHLVKAIRPRA